MTVGFKLSHRLARGFWALGVTAVLAGCTGEQPFQPSTKSPTAIRTITVSPAAASIHVDSTLQLTVELRDSLDHPLSGRTITWTSDKANIARVSANGLVAGEDTGTATITAGSEGKFAYATVRVLKKGAVDTTPPEPTVRAGFYVSPSGSSAGDGSYARPWDLGSALANAAGLIQPGDTVWLRGGTYRGHWRTQLQGVSGKPVVVRQYPGERAVIDGAGTTASTFFVEGPYIVFWGFEIMNSNPTRTFSQDGGDLRSNVIANYASHTKYINLVIHDGGVGVYNEASVGDVEIVGNIIYNSGWQGSDRGHAHALYLKSNSGPVTARDNIMFNQFGYGAHVYSNAGSGSMNNIRLEGNIAFNNGSQAQTWTASNIQFGGEATATGGVVKANYTYDSPGTTARNVRLGYETTKNGTMQLVDNYFAGGGTVLEVGYWSSLTSTGNKLIGTGTVVQAIDPALSLSKFSGQILSTLPTATKVVVRKNAYEQGRANIAVYNWGQQSSVSVDLSGIVPSGAKYEIRNVQAFFGSPVVSGTYSGGSVTLPIRAVSPPAPIGMSSARSPSTGTTFGAYVVTIRQ